MLVVFNIIFFTRFVTLTCTLRDIWCFTFEYLRMCNKPFYEIAYQISTKAPSEIENHLIPYNFNSKAWKGDNLGQVEFLMEFEAI